MVQFTKTFYGRESESLEKEIAEKKDSPEFIKRLVEQSPAFQEHLKKHPKAELKPREDKKDMSEIEKAADKWQKDSDKADEAQKAKKETGKPDIQYGDQAKKGGGPIYGQGQEEKKAGELYGGHDLGHYDCGCGASFKLKEEGGKPSVSYLSPGLMKVEEEGKSKGPGYSGVKAFAEASTTVSGYATGGGSGSKSLYR